MKNGLIKVMQVIGPVVGECFHLTRAVGITEFLGRAKAKVRAKGKVQAREKAKANAKALNSFPDTLSRTSLQELLSVQVPSKNGR